MTNCPKCGTANLDESRFCTKCGTMLSAPAERRCPMCARMNPAANICCDSCGARLAPATPASASALEPPAPPPPPSPHVEAPGESDDWLRRLRGNLPESSAPDETVPDWLRGREAESAESVEESSTFDLAARLGGGGEPAPTPGAPVPEVPDWLTPFAPKTPAALTPATSEPESVPDWLKDLVPTAKTPPPPPVAPAPVEAETPRVARRAQLEPPSPPSESPAAPPFAEEGVPDWLSQLGTLPAVAPAQGAPPAIESEIPLEAPRPSLPPTVPSPRKPASTAFVGEVKPEPTEPVPAAPAQAEPLVELPDWLKELGPAKASAAAPPALTETPSLPTTAGGLVAAELPLWLKELQPVGATAEPEKEEPAETEGVLEGVHGALPAAEIVSQALGAGMPRPLYPQIPAGDSARARALAELLARGAGAVVRREGASPAQRLWSNTQRWLVFLAIAVLAVLPLVQPNLLGGLVSAPPPDPVNEDMFNSIQALPSGAPVLVAFDYDATQSPEMDTQARVLLRHLSARKANIKVASLYQAGPAVAQAVVNQINSTLTGTLPIKVEQHGYLPGQDAAVALFIQSTPISMVVELAATPDTVRWWAEQLAARSDAPTFLAGVSASAEPMSRPYVASHQVSGMIVGVPGATAYRLKLREVLQDDKDEREQVLAPLASIGLVNMALVALMVLGGLVQLVSGRKPQPATRSGGRQRG